ncbi:MAG: D-alanyl-D-alanine carboxypeptidase/D-alanyl-D-alanine-endopeptidase [Oceanidesulfovibrio sp.]
MRTPFRHILLSALLVAFFSVFAVGAHGQQQDAPARTAPPRAVDDDLLRVELLGLATDPKLARAHLGLYVKSLTTGEVLLDVNGERLFIPASTMKLFTTAAAISLLGPDYTYRTPVLLHGVVEDGALRGDLVVRGVGDPSFSGIFHDDRPLAVFEEWAQTLKQRGVRRIEGDLVGDATFFQGPPLGEGWNWDDESYWYSAQTGALAFNESTANVTVRAVGAPGEPVGWEMAPVPGYLEVENEAENGPAGTAVSFVAERRRGANVLEMAGVLPRGQQARFAVSLEDPAAWFLYALRHVLQANGVAVQGSTRAVRDPSDAGPWIDATPLAIYTSPPLSALATYTNRESHNFYAEQLLKTMGAVKMNLGTARAGAEAVMSWAATMGVDRGSLVMVDGSGLSRKNLVSPRAMVAMLGSMRNAPAFESFYETMPVAGCHGSLANRMCGTLAENVARAKVGYVTHDISLAGYTRNQGGEWYAYALFVNNHAGAVRDAKAMQDAIVIALTAAE